MIASPLAMLLLQAAIVPEQSSAEPVPAEVRAEEEAAAAEPIMPHEVSLRVGTSIRLRLLSELSTKVTQKGETFELEVTEDVQSGGWLLVPAGTMAVGEVTRSDAKGAFGKSGKLEARILYLKLDGRSVRLSGALGVTGEGGTTETVLTVIAAGTLAFAVTGKSAVLEAGTELIARTDRSIALRPIRASE